MRGPPRPGTAAAILSPAPSAPATLAGTHQDHDRDETPGARGLSDLFKVPSKASGEAKFRPGAAAAGNRLTNPPILTCFKDDYRDLGLARVCTPHAAPPSPEVRGAPESAPHSFSTAHLHSTHRAESLLPLQSQ